MAAIQVFLMYGINTISVGTTVSVRYTAGVRNSGVSGGVPLYIQGWY